VFGDSETKLLNKSGGGKIADKQQILAPLLDRKEH
jgi:hypothetical protein